jgi:cytochrome P450
MAGHRAKTIESLHQKYGPVVQFGPNEVSFDSIDAVDIIYGAQSECIKSPWYDSVTRDGVFKLRHIAEHRDRRKKISRAFSPTSAYELEPNVASLVHTFMTTIENHRQDGPLEMRHWFRMLAFDLSGAAFVGASYGGLEADESPQFLSDMENAFLIWDLEGRFPVLMWFVERIPSKSLQHFFNGIDRLYRFSDEIFNKYVNNYGRSPNRKDIVAKLIQKEPNSVQGLTDYQLSCEIANLTFAATDTTSLVLSFVFWELALNQEIQEQLRTELKNAEIDPETNVPTYQSLVKLPYLNAVINETMRLHSPIPMGLLRQAPPGGCNIEGYFIPGEVSNPTLLPSSVSLLIHP